MDYQWISIDYAQLIRGHLTTNQKLIWARPGQDRLHKTSGRNTFNIFNFDVTAFSLTIFEIDDNPLGKNNYMSNGRATKLFKLNQEKYKRNLRK